MLVPGEDHGIEMVDMLMADENEDVVVSLQLFGRDLFVRGQFPALSAPVVEDGQRMPARNGKTAVIVMGDQQVLLHEDVHLHGNSNSVLRLFQRGQDKKHLSQSRLEEIGSEPLLNRSVTPFPTFVKFSSWIIYRNDGFRYIQSII